MSSLALPKEAQRNDIPIDEKNILLFLKLQHNKHRIVISGQTFYIVQVYSLFKKCQGVLKKREGV